jgi:hypothetical protein
MNPLIVLLLALVTLPHTAAAELPPRNVALGRPYTLSPTPNYGLTTDACDSSQLTDGKHAGAGFWTDEAPVGWVGEKLVSITIDLGSPFDISGASFSTAAGSADVEWPSTVLVLGSVDGRGYSLLGDLVALDAAAGRAPRSASFQRHAYVSSELEGQARFVRLMVGAAGPYVFADEIEIFGQRAVASHAPRASTTDTDALFWRVKAASRLRAEVERRLLEARTRLSTSRIALQDRMSLLARLSKLEQRVSRISTDDWSRVDAQYPMNDVHAAALAIVGAVERLEGAPALSVWTANPWDPLDMTSAPPKVRPPAIDVTLMNGEVRSAAISLRNSTAQPVVVTIELADVDALDPGWIEARPVAWTGDVEGQAVALALLQPDPNAARAVLEIPAGVTRQLWLTFAPTKLATGQHQLALRVASPGRPDLAVAANVRILAGRFPATPRLHVGGWDYVNDRRGGAPPDTLAATTSLLRSFGVDLPWATAAAMPFGEHGPDGSMIRTPDTTVFDTWIARWPHAARYRVFISARDDLSGLRRGTPAFQVAVRSWATFWATHVATRGVHPGDVDLLFVDEPHGSGDDAERQIGWARALNESGSGFQVWLDPVYADPAETPADLVRTANTLCLNRQLLEQSLERHRTFATRLIAAGKVLEIYGANGPATKLDPYSYYRLMAWRAFDVGALAVGFWSFTDTGSGSSWREYLAPRPIYSPLFLDRTSVVPGKHLYAIREGVQDYEYLALLRDAIARDSEMRPPHEPSLARARGVLKSAVSRILKVSRPESYAWDSATDRALADAARLEIAQELQRLSAAQPIAP